MIDLKIQSGGRVVIGAGVLNRCSEFLDKRFGPRCAIVSDTNVAQLFGGKIERILASAGFEPTLITVPSGEQSKALEQVGAVCERLIAARLDRRSFVVGLGGGVIGDISGFVAAIFHRGIPHVQIPTTLLAMVDSSIGGKTGVNTRAGKNLIGAIHHPILVVDDVDVLRTLPRREFNQGFAEIIKHAVIADAAMFGDLEARASNAIDLQPLIARNVEIKSKIVAKDERDRSGARAILNFGHTVGHAIEQAGNYRTFRHGEALSLGIVAACIVSVKKAGMAREQCDAIVDLLRGFELPTKLPADFPREKILKALPLDKKFENGNVRFVVTPRIGMARLANDVTMEDIHAAVEGL